MLDFGRVELIDPTLDNSIGTEGKLAAHVNGDYHRAISVLLVDSAGRHILQRRANTKYHCPGLWANACCSHPAPGEPSSVAVERRVREELGVSSGIAAPPYRLGVIRYRATVPASPHLPGDHATLIENERVALFCGFLQDEFTDGGLSMSAFRPDPDEIQDMKAVSQREALAMDAATMAPWLKLYLGIFGGDLAEIVAACRNGSWSPRDYGSFDLDVTPPAFPASGSI